MEEKITELEARIEKLEKAIVNIKVELLDEFITLLKKHLAKVHEIMGVKK